MSWRVIYWFWLPPEKRDPWAGASEVKDARSFELQALAAGELEEVRFNVTWPETMATREATALLQADYDRRCMKRVGFIPRVGGLAAPVFTEAGRACQQARTRIIV